MNEEKRCFTGDEEGFHFLVEHCGYSWDEIERLYIMSHVVSSYGTFKKELLKKELTQHLKNLEADNG